MSTKLKSYMDNFLGVKVSDDMLELIKMGLEEERIKSKKNITLSSYVRSLLEKQLDLEFR